MTRPTVLVMMGGYWPGHEATGPNQSLRQMCAALQDRADFRIVGRDRPFDGEPTGETGCWIEREAMGVRYVAPGRGLWQRLGAIVRETPHDLLWLNGYHDPEFTLGPLLYRRAGRLPARATLLSTRGELAAGAITLKSWKKRLYGAMMRRSGMLRDVWLHATSSGEAADAAKAAPFARGVLTAPNVRLPVAAQPGASPTSEALRIVSVGRVTAVKNVLAMIEVLGRVERPVQFHLYGPIEEPDYWARCRAGIAALPPHVAVEHHPPVPNEQIPAIMAQSDLFFAMTRGENFGHAIFEALACGVPVLISDRTPWDRLEERDAGWALPLEHEAEFAARIDAVATADERQRARRSAGAVAVAADHLARADAEGRTMAMIEQAIAAGPRA